MKQLELNEVYSFKLTSGEELVAKVINQDISKDEVELSNPLSVAPNHQGMGLIPAMFTSDMDKNVTLNTSNVTLSCITDDKLKIKYIEATTGITTTSKKLILG